MSIISMKSLFWPSHSTPAKQILKEKTCRSLPQKRRIYFHCTFLSHCVAQIGHIKIAGMVIYPPLLQTFSKRLLRRIGFPIRGAEYARTGESGSHFVNVVKNRRIGTCKSAKSSSCLFVFWKHPVSVREGCRKKIFPFYEKKNWPPFVLEIESLITKTNFTLGPIKKSFFLFSVKMVYFFHYLTI